MLTYTGSRIHFGDLVNDPTETTLVIGDRLINHQIKRLLGKRNWPFLETTVPFTTVASQQFYDLPITCKRAKSLYLTVSSTRYTVKTMHPSSYAESKKIRSAKLNLAKWEDKQRSFWLLVGAFFVFVVWVASL